MILPLNILKEQLANAKKVDSALLENLSFDFT
jgi:hypothetical protein